MELVLFLGGLIKVISIALKYYMAKRAKRILGGCIMTIVKWFLWALVSLVTWYVGGILMWNLAKATQGMFLLLISLVVVILVWIIIYLLRELRRPPTTVTTTHP